MARTDEVAADIHAVPTQPDKVGWRHWGDGLAGRYIAARLQGFYPTNADYRDVQVDANGVVQTAGGGAGGGAATIADGADVAQGTTTDLSSANTVVGILKAIKAAITGTVVVSGTFFQATQPVSLATNTPDVTDRAARLLGHVTVDSAPTTAVTGTFFQVTQPVSLATNTPDVTDRAARLLGHVTVDSAPAVTGTVTSNQGTANATPWNDNIAQYGGAATSLAQKASASSIPVVPASDWLTEAVPTGGFGNPSLRVYVNSIRKSTYQAFGRNISSGALTANTLKAMLSLEHAVGSTKNARVRRVWVTGVVSAAGGAVVTDIAVQFTRGTAASTGGSAVTPTLANAAQSAADTVVKTLPTIVAATVVFSSTILVTAAAGATIGMLIPRTLVYDWSEAGSVEPFILRASTLESLVLNVLSASTPTVQLSMEVEFTEE